MVKTQIFRDIASEIQLFRDIDQKETFVFVVGALFSRLISLQKASEIMEMESDMLLKLLDLMGLQFSYLSEEDIPVEKEW